MKCIKPLLLAGTVFLCLSNSLSAQKFSEDYKRSFKVNNQNPQSVLALYNLTGSVKVEGYQGNEVLIEVKKNISASTEDALAQGKAEVKLEMEQYGDSILVYLSGPYSTLPKSEKRDGWKRIPYHYNHDFVIKVPMNMRLHLATVNEGDVQVKDVRGEMELNNVNGSIFVEQARSATQAYTVNGKVEVSYAVNPVKPSSYKTINGSITVRYQEGFNADLYFKSMMGKYYTDFDGIETLNGTVEKNTDKSGKGTVYKLNKNVGVRIGNGGKDMRFETLNGDIYIKKM